MCLSAASVGAGPCGQGPQGQASRRIHTDTLSRAQMIPFRSDRLPKSSSHWLAIICRTIAHRPVGSPCTLSSPQPPPRPLHPLLTSTIEDTRPSSRSPAISFRKSQSLSESLVLGPLLSRSLSRLMALSFPTVGNKCRRLQCLKRCQSSQNEGPRS